MLKIYIYFFSMLDILFLPFMAKNQNTSTKFQINSKIEISMTETNLFFPFYPNSSSEIPGYWFRSGIYSSCVSAGGFWLILKLPPLISSICPFLSCKTFSASAGFSITRGVMKI